VLFGDCRFSSSSYWQPAADGRADRRLPERAQLGMFRAQAVLGAGNLVIAATGWMRPSAQGALLTRGGGRLACLRGVRCCRRARRGVDRLVVPDTGRCQPTGNYGRARSICEACPVRLCCLGGVVLRGARHRRRAVGNVRRREPAAADPDCPGASRRNVKIQPPLRRNDRRPSRDGATLTQSRGTVTHEPDREF
jgi:hypothetical protein